VPTVKAAPGFPALSDLAAFERDVDAASFRRLRRRQYRRMQRILVREGIAEFNERGLRLVQHALFAYYVDGREEA